MDIMPLLSTSTQKLKSSKIRELLKMANVPGIISMAGGMPDSENFPFEEIKHIINAWPYERAKIALQYGTTKGFEPLLEKIKEWMETKKGISMKEQDIIITTGSQQALSLISKLFLNPDDTVLVEIPSFIGAIASFYSFMGNVEGVKMDAQGIVIEDLIKRIDARERTGKKVKFMYTIPNFNNPSGITLSQSRRKKLLEVSYEYNILIIEDDPYGELFYYGAADDYKPIKSFDHRGNVLYLGTFSKVLSPGIRVGWVVAGKEIIEKLELQKQSFDACTPTLSQLIALDCMKRGYINKYTEKMKLLYKEKRNTALHTLEQRMPDGVSWTKPNGGLFIWLTLPSGMNAEDVFSEAVKQKVAFVTGDAFLPAGYPNNYIRLSYSDLPSSRIEEGIAILAGVIRKMI